MISGGAGPGDLQVTPLQFIEVKALMGDASDNIPGVPKVGEKTATQLIREFGSVDGVYEHLDEVKKPALHKTLAENEDKARMSLFLAAIKTDCDVELDMEKAAAGGYYTKEAFELCTELGFKNILPRFDRDVVEETAGGFEPLEIVEEKALAQMKDTLLSRSGAVRNGHRCGGLDFRVTGWKARLSDRCRDHLHLPAQERGRNWFIGRTVPVRTMRSSLLFKGTQDRSQGE